ncbi:MAG TPA: MBL fold metallo-hydrolase [Marmoricola sp.]|nr:MBL fold metallo-hydrolase [Marmoricola sp.]
MTEFSEVADRVWVARHEWFDVNVSVVAGERGLLVVDTFASTAGARGVLEDVRRLAAGLSDAPGGLPVLTAVNTHVHFDHSFGNGVFAGAGAELVCHEAAAADLPEHAASVRAEAAQDLGEDPRYAELVETDEVVPSRTFSSALALDLGDRMVELVHPGRGHTAGDVVVRVPDTDALLAGDLVEESAARDGVPGFGDDCWPLDWPLTLDLVVGLLTPDSVVVPGHGAPVGLEFVQEQRATIGVVAETIRDLAGRGVPVEQALAAAEWPWPSEQLGAAVRRGYEQLPRSSKRLPLL